MTLSDTLFSWRFRVKTVINILTEILHANRGTIDMKLEKISQRILVSSLESDSLCGQLRALGRGQNRIWSWCISKLGE